MLTQLLIASAIITGTLIIQVLFIGAAIFSLGHAGPWLAKPPHTLKIIIALITVVLWLIAGISVGAWIWAFAFIALGAFSELEPALYFSIVTYTTLGYGDVILPIQMRILGSLAAVNGLIILGLNTAFLVEFITRLRSAQIK